VIRDRLLEGPLCVNRRHSLYPSIVKASGCRLKVHDGIGWVKCGGIVIDACERPRDTSDIVLCDSV